MRSASDISLLIDLWSIAVEMGIGPAAFPKAWKEKLVSRWCCAGGRGLVLVATCSVGIRDQRGLQEVMLRPPRVQKVGIHLPCPPRLGALKGKTWCQGSAKQRRSPQPPAARLPPPKSSLKGKGH